MQTTQLSFVTLWSYYDETDDDNHGNITNHQSHYNYADVIGITTLYYTNYLPGTAYLGLLPIHIASFVHKVFLVE